MSMDKVTFNLIKLLQYPLLKSPIKLVKRCNWGLSEVNRFTIRQHNCGDLSDCDIGKKVTLYGWVKHNRSIASANFIIINDAYGETQLVVKKNNSEKVPIGSVIKAEGIVQRRPESAENSKLKTGLIEVIVDSIEVINKKSHPTTITREPDRLAYRYVDLRNRTMQSNLRLKSHVMMNTRNFLCQEGFVEIETPLLQKHTPGGAHEYVVPTREENKFYCLAQSPQIFKQLLMIGGVDRYFQIARCIRDEVSRPDRQPEFSQIDLEMSFTNVDGIIDLVETLLVAIWPSFAGSVSIPFPRLTYFDALTRYGSDKPDLRSDIELKDVSQPLHDLIGTSALALCIPNGLDKNLKSKLNELSSIVKEDLSYDQNIVGFHINDPDNWSIDCQSDFRVDEATKYYLTQTMKINKGDYLFIAYGDEKKIQRFMGKLRNQCVKCMAESNNISNCHDNSFIWITDFPLFTINPDTQGFECTHHPFSAPKSDQISKLFTNPLEVIGDQFDLVLNGEEVGGGSMRIHDASLQEYILKDILKSDYSTLQFFLDALRSGAPPHGGIALGLDRLIRIICNANSIRDVIAFPKSFQGKDPLSGAPTSLPSSILNSYYIKSKS